MAAMTSGDEQDEEDECRDHKRGEGDDSFERHRLVVKATAAAVADDERQQRDGHDQEVEASLHAFKTSPEPSIFRVPTGPPEPAAAEQQQMPAAAARPWN
jgi:hypothetical protein